MKVCKLHRNEDLRVMTVYLEVFGTRAGAADNLDLTCTVTGTTVTLQLYHTHLGCPIRKPYHTWLKRALTSLIRLACVRTQHRCQMLPQMTCSLAKSLDA
jgi:hypothetical protein